MKDLSLHLKQLRQQLPELLDCLHPGASRQLDTWCRVLDVKLLSRFGPEFPLVAAVCGGGSSGKSTLVNSLAGRRISPVGGTAGLNRRVLLLFNPRWLESGFFLPALEETLDVKTAPLQTTDQLETPGEPLYAALSSMPENLVLLDTPDFDTGARGLYTNRQSAKKWLETADLLIYLFTNSNYANCDNTDFLRQVLTGIGNRPCLLVYRSYPGMDSKLVQEHAGLVAKNIYGRNHKQMVLGVFRADEDNAVAEGGLPLTIRPADGGSSFMNRLAGVDAAVWRRRIAASALEDIVHQSRQAAETAARYLAHLDLYRAALKTIEARCVTEALAHFPSERVLNLFTRIWLQTDPTHVRLMRKTGNLVEWPLAKLSRAVKYLKGQKQTRAESPDLESQRRTVEIDLLQAADHLLRAATADSLSIELPEESDLGKMASTFDTMTAVGTATGNLGTTCPVALAKNKNNSGQNLLTIKVDLPACLKQAQTSVRRIDQGRLNLRLAGCKDQILQPSSKLESDLQQLASGLREEMGLLDQLRQTAAAMLNVLPATAAVTYIISTGDPVGAAAIKIKLGGLFGLKDLYALIAIPATSSLKKADRQQLQKVLGPVARSWLDSKLSLVQNLFAEHITGQLVVAADQIHTTASGLLEQVEALTDRIQKKGTQ